MSKQSDLVSVSQGASGDPLFIDTVHDRVGVGTSSPSAKLQVGTTINSTALILDGTNYSAGGQQVRVDFTNGGSTHVYSRIASETGAAAWSGELVFATNPGTSQGSALVERMRIDLAGRVTTPYQPMFKVNGNTSQWLRMGSAGVWYVITNAVGVNDAAGILGANLSTDANGSVVGSGFNATTGRFTAPVAGMYLFTLSLYVSKITADGAYIHINSEINGGVQGDYSIFGPRPALNGYIDGLNMSWLNYLQANDTWAPAIYNGNANSVDIYANYVRIGGYLLG
jgi:hypothetical protein